MTQEREPAHAEQVRRELDRILARQEFDDEPSLLQEFLTWLGDLFGGNPAGGATQTLLWVFFLVLASGLIYVLIRLLRAGRHARRGDQVSEGGPTVRERVAGLRREALEAERQGEWRLALRLFLFALIVGLGERGTLRYHDAWTNRELLERGRPSRSTYDLLAPLIQGLEAKEFGHEAILPGDVERLRGLCDEHLGPLREQAA